MTLDPHVLKWWDIANQRRGKLILKKCGEGLSQKEMAEFVLLQGVCSMVMSYHAPLDLRPLEKLAAQAERLAKRINKAALKARALTKGKEKV